MDKFWTNVALFDRTNNAESSKNLAIDLKPSAALELFSALGALGRWFESCRPDS